MAVYMGRGGSRGAMRQLSRRGACHQNAPIRGACALRHSVGNKNRGQTRRSSDVAAEFWGCMSLSGSDSAVVVDILVAIAREDRLCR
jgi:hypothetical protein